MLILLNSGCHEVLNVHRSTQKFGSPKHANRFQTAKLSTVRDVKEYWVSALIHRRHTITIIRIIIIGYWWKRSAFSIYISIIVLASVMFSILLNNMQIFYVVLFHMDNLKYKV